MVFAHFHSIDADGTLYVKASGWEGHAHWNGQHKISPTDPDYAFWRWLVSQKEYHRLIKESELAVAREHWVRQTGQV